MVLGGLVGLREASRIHGQFLIVGFTGGADLILMQLDQGDMQWYITNDTMTAAPGEDFMMVFRLKRSKILKILCASCNPTSP